MHLFIDTNIFLDFYHLTSDDLEELKKLSALLQSGEVRLHLPIQITDEFYRNRSKVIAEAIKRLKEQKLNLHFPALCKDYEQYPALRSHQEEYEKLHSTLLNKIIDDAGENKLRADERISEIFTHANTIDTTNRHVELARLRMDVGNPPGKNGSLGDAINWEILLETIPDNEDLYFVTGDGDYLSSLDRGNFSEFLIKEWEKISKSNLFFFKRLSSFFKEHYPDIKLASDLEITRLIGELRLSGSFADTHRVIGKLQKFGDYSDYQLQGIVEAFINNNQVFGIISDGDVMSFISNALSGNQNRIEGEYLEALKYYTSDYLDEDFNIIE